MQFIKFECKVITPIICFGVNQQMPELRVPSLRGLLRYWWRSIHANLSLEQLKEEEVRLFGGSFNDKQQKSIFNLQIINQEKPSIRNFRTLPSKSWSSKNGIDALNQFTIMVGINSNDLILKEQLTNLMLLVSLLGGIGGRTRRGLGSFKIVSVENNQQTDIDNAEKIEDVIRKINPNFSFSVNNGNDYPYLEKIQIGDIAYDNYDDCLNMICDNAHTFDGPYTGFVRGGEKYSSPICVSIIEIDNKFYPIVTSLKITIYTGIPNDKVKKDDFINAVLRGK